MVENTQQLLKQKKDITDIPDEELRWCTASLSEVKERNNRLEASVFDIEGKHARELLKRCKWELKSFVGKDGFATAYHRPRFKRIWVEESEYPIYQPSQILEINPKPSSYISHKTNTDIEALRVKKGQILLTCSGTTANCTLVNETFDNMIFSHDLIRINCKDDNDIGYIYAFLKTSVGRNLIRTNNYGAVVSHIEPDHLKQVPIPVPSLKLKKEITQTIMDSFILRDESNCLLKKAEELLLEELRLPQQPKKMEPNYFDEEQKVKAFNTKLAETKVRFEASYNDPFISKILNHLELIASEVKCIGSSQISKDIILPGRFKRVYVKEGQGTVFFGGKHIFELDPSNKKYLSTRHHKKRISNELALKENMILITRSGTIGKANITPKHWENWVINEHVIRVIPRNIGIAGYIYVFLSSKYGELIIKRFTYGSVVDEIDDNHVSKVAIPILKNQTVQNEINELALKANKKRYKAYKLEQQAIKLVRQEVVHTKK